MTTSATGEVEPTLEREARAYREGRRRLRMLHTQLAGRRHDWANNTENPCSTARAVAYQSAMASISSIIDEIEAIAGGVRGTLPVCTDPNCTIPRKPGFPMHGPHDFRASSVTEPNTKEQV